MFPKIGSFARQKEKVIARQNRGVRDFHLLAFSKDFLPQSQNKSTGARATLKSK
jgi:hypothetical protein